MVAQMLISILLTAFSPAHDFKMSVCEISYIEEQRHIEAKFYIFQDDLKTTLYGDPLAPALQSKDVSDYILKKIKLSIGGEPIVLAFSEMKEREDQVQVIFYSDQLTLTTGSKILISNQLLIEKFKQQTNMVYLVVPGHDKITHIMNGGKTDLEIGI